MYRVSPEGLRRMDYCDGVEGFINYTRSNPRNISEGGIRCLCKRCKNKKVSRSDIIMMHLLQKRFKEKYLCWFTTICSLRDHDKKYGWVNF
jgi:hypothetical protein